MSADLSFSLSSPSLSVTMGYIVYTLLIVFLTALCDPITWVLPAAVLFVLFTQQPDGFAFCIIGGTCFDLVALVASQLVAIMFAA